MNNFHGGRVSVNYFLFIIVSIVFALIISCSGGTNGTNLKFEISFPESVSDEPLTGRMFLAFAHDESREPRLQVGRYGVQFFGVDFENLQPGEKVTIDGSTLGYPFENLADLSEREYYLQAVLNIYTKFERSDGKTVWIHMDQWEGQNWRRSPGNLYSDVQKITINPAGSGTYEFEVSNVIPPIEPPTDTDWVKSIKIQSDILTEFWGHPIYIGARVLLPKGYNERPNVQYPTLYYQGHFSLGNPMRFNENGDDPVSRDWMSENFPRFLVVTIQHPSPYFDDSYAVNSVNNGPFGDAIHQELIPEIERQFRAIPESYARVLTGGSTGGWESFALQVFYPDFYGGTWSFSPDPLDFRNVEGINIYEDKNAFYKEHEWYKVPTANTRFSENGEVRLTTKQRITMELVNGTKGRSGQQLDIWSAVNGPLGDDGYFKPLFDKKTGVIDPDVAQYWKENYDMRYILERDWKTLGPKLVGKLHVFAGRMDNYYLNIGVYHMEEFLESTRDPYYAGSFNYGARGGHGWRPFNSAELIRIMAEHITKNAPPGTNTRAWKY
ncbi:hypothetical protein IIB79_06750 [candidate division KSB1 bacterium]|nr:hypothetical protein [candidate division KSB1 bacterium]